MGVRRPAILEPAITARLGFRPFSQPVTNEFVDHRLDIVVRLLRLEQGLDGSDAAGGARAAFACHQTAPNPRAARNCTSAAAAASAPLLCLLAEDRSIACCSLCTVSSPLPTHRPNCSATVVNPAIA